MAPSRTPSPAPSDAAPRCSPAASTGPSGDPCWMDPGCCYVDRSDVMVAEEARLRLALVGLVGNPSATFTVEDVWRAIAGATGLGCEAFCVKPFHPENFLVICSSQGARDRVLGASPVPLGTTTLSLRQWTRLVHAESDTLLFKVTLELDGVPAHA
ncbi:hypothetical protein C2845_PM08G27090 [Panicum miliaceum]|uniref:Uncharacterized protein n=1 Tax=Panicum miliaceum TaxID=4540 RepID=A0A3L6R178_PANMI|nr:hypothetical protein C2845_PM08G27090 [Panicum miliaceum]